MLGPEKVLNLSYWMLLVELEQCLRKACVITVHAAAWRKGLEPVRRPMWDCIGVTETQIDTETETRQEGAEWNKEAQETGKGQWPAGRPVRSLLSPICILSPCHSSEGHSMPTGCFLVPRPSDRQEGGIKREQVEKRGWRETGLGRPLPASPATPWTMSSLPPASWN